MTRLGLQLLLAVATAAPLAPQTVSEACSPTTSPAEAVRCADVALGLQAAQGDLALLNAGGVDLAGAASTLGKRVGSGPRYSASGRIALVTFEGPDLRSSSVTPAPGRSAVAPAIQGALGLGVFRGFSPTPTAGGVLAVDLLATG
jgi:hypothetical protein